MKMRFFGASTFEIKRKKDNRKFFCIFLTKKGQAALAIFWHMGRMCVHLSEKGQTNWWPIMPLFYVSIPLSTVKLDLIYRLDCLSLQSTRQGRQQSDKEKSQPSIDCHLSRSFFNFDESIQLIVMKSTYMQVLQSKWSR